MLTFMKPLSPRQFSAVVIGSSIAAFLVVAAFNFVVNPYAQYPTRVVTPLVQTSRAQKAGLLRRAKQAPEGLILGSSRVLKYEPQYLRERMGMSFFNAGVNYGKIEDSLAFYRFYIDRFGHSPKVVLLGLDVHGFNDHLPTDPRLLNESELMQQVVEFVKFSDRFQGTKELVSWQQFVASMKAVKSSLRGGAATESADLGDCFRSDGLVVYQQREKQLRAGTYDFAAAMSYNKREYKQLFQGYQEFSARRLEVLQTLVDECRKGGSRLMVFLTPMHPDLVDYLADTTTYVVRRDELNRMLASSSTKHGFDYCDLSDIASFGGTATAFVDGIHPLEPNTRRALDRLLVLSRLDSHYVVQ